MDYEFRFYRKGLLEALHVTVLSNDGEALERARAYLNASPHFQYIEVRSGLRFIDRVANNQPGPGIKA